MTPHEHRWLQLAAEARREKRAGKWPTPQAWARKALGLEQDEEGEGE